MVVINRKKIIFWAGIIATFMLLYSITAYNVNNTKNKTVATIWAIIVTITVGFANIFTILQPAIESKDYVSTGFQLIGPIVFGLIAFFLITRYEKKYGSKDDSIDKIA